jgi:hypothetical protein
MKPSVRQSATNTPREGIRDALERARPFLTHSEPPPPPPASETNEKRLSLVPEPWTDGELEDLVQYRLSVAINEGFPPRNVQAFLADQRKRELATEAGRAGWIRRCAAGISAHGDGKRITGHRWVRGTHSGTFVRDPLGRDELPKGYAA